MDWPLSFRSFRSLTWKFAFATATLLILTCCTLSWMLLQRQIQSITEGLLESGTLLAQQFARTSRHSLVSGDTAQLHRSMKEVLAAPQVAYVALLDLDRRIELGYGKERWAHQFTPTAAASARFSLTGLILKRVSQHQMTAPLISAVLLDSDTPSVRPTTQLSLRDLGMLIAGVQRPLFFDIAISVPATAESRLDAALDLTLQDPQEAVQEPPKSDGTRLAIVQLGLSTTSLQATLRATVARALLLTAGFLLVSTLGAIFFARKLTTPLQALTTAASLVGQGERPAVTPPHGHDEIGTLAEVFNRMVEALKNREAELRQLTHTLEDRVRDRTTELESANEKLRLIDQRKSVFVSTASHELRTPLTSMRMNLANIREGIEGPITPGQRGVLTRIENSLLRLQQMIQKLLDLSQIESGDLRLSIKPLHLPALIAQAVDSLDALAKEKRVTIDVQIPSQLPQTDGDEDRVLQILTNLLHNAIKFSPLDSSVTVLAQPISEGMVSVSVADHGIGVLPDEAERIFSPFYRSPRAAVKARGTGLGLTIAKHLAEMHQGRLWVESTAHGGSSFIFTLPVFRETRI